VGVTKTSWLSENADEVAALSLVFAGIYLVVTNNYQQGASLITLGTGYLFGKNQPKTKTPQGGLPYGQ